MSFLKRLRKLTRLHNLSQLKRQSLPEVHSCTHELLEAVAEGIRQQVTPCTARDNNTPCSIGGWADPDRNRDLLLLVGADGDVRGVRDRGWGRCLVDGAAREIQHISHLPIEGGGGKEASSGWNSSIQTL